MYSSQVQLDKIQQMADAVRERTAAAQSQLRDASFFISKQGARRLAAVAWGVAGVGASVAIGAAVMTVAPVVAVVGVGVASAVAGAGAALSVTASKREAQRTEAQRFLSQAKTFFAELHKAYTDIRAEQSQASNQYNPSADLVNYQAQRTQMTQSSSSSARHSTSASERNSSGPRLG